MKSNTRCLAFPDIVVEAFSQLPLFHFFGCDAGVAKTNLIEFPYQFHHGIQRASMTEGTIIGTCLFIDGSCFDNAWKILICDAYRRVGLTIFQQNVVERLVFLDEVVFLNQCILISRHHHIFDVLNFADKNVSFAILVGVVEVRTNAPFQVLCLSHINHLAIFI